MKKSKNKLSKKRYYYSIKIDDKLHEHEEKENLFIKKEDYFISTVLKLIQIEKNTNSHEAIILTIRSLTNVGWSKISTIRSILKTISQKGVFILAYVENPSNKEYFLASVANKIVSTPSEVFMTIGLQMELPYYKKLLEKVGIFPQFERKGKFKSFGEQFTLDDISNENKMMLDGVLDNYYNNIIQLIADSRNKSSDEIGKWFDEGPYSTTSAKEMGLIDDCKYRDELKEYLKECLKTDMIVPKPLKEYNGKRSIKNRLSKRKKIAIININGHIVQGKSHAKYSTGNLTISKIIRQLMKKSSIKGVILTINSGGGSAVASDLIWRDIVKLKEKKPIVCLMQDVAASGGYYIGIACNKIVADPFSIIGSIGVVSGKFSIEQLNEKLGVNKVVLKRGANADLFSISKPFSDKQKQKLVQEMIETTYSLFVKRVSEGRKKSVEDIENVAQGKIWTGFNGIDTGLIDVQGGFHNALFDLLNQLKLSESVPFKLVFYPKQKWSLNPLFLLQSRLRKFISDIIPSIEHYNMLEQENLLYLMPYDITIT